jgi:hypothetical protein
MRFASPFALRFTRPLVLAGSAALVAASLAFGCGGSGSETSTGTFGAGGTGSSSSGSGQGGKGGDLFMMTVGSSTSGGMTSSSGSTTGTGGMAPVCDGNPTTGPVQWAVKNDDASGQYALTITADVNGFTYIAGSYSGTLTLGGKTADVTNANKAMFVAKLGADGSAKWVRGFAAVKTGLPDPLATGRGIAVDSVGNVYVLGDFTGQISFGGGTPTLTCAGNFFGDIFLLKLDGSGNPTAVHQIGDPLATTPASGGSTQTSRGIALKKTTANGEQIAIVGDSQGTLDIGGGKTAQGGGVAAAFVAGFDTSLNPKFLVQMGNGTIDQSTHAVAWDKNDDLLITGNTKGAINFPGGMTLTPAGTQAAFVAKIKGDGSSTVWAKLFGSGTAGGEGIAASPSGDVFIAGDHTGDIDFGGGVLGNSFGANVYVAKLDGTGNHVWSHSFGDSNSQHARGLAVDAMGRAVIAGQYSSKIDFGGGALTSAGNDDMFVAKLDTHGCQVWAKSFGDSMLQSANALALDSMGNALVAGQMQGAFSIGSTMLTAQGDDSVVVKIGP